ncbi:HlyD family secretion protein [Anaerobacterium chartisolvens]|uniref:HlyD family secretion protein n=1 Tax=Anaerobacterium chartisolvens TaxID=1297424 RepID=A0A369B513_9FIRM|nr:HlyD family efflux transporter periplasmic adaptor subunit [Anaerobacterium chartisolvens]RCX16531.1 HlyD family secretion protein [Anaerobacterium chartisolvens]
MRLQAVKKVSGFFNKSVLKKAAIGAVALVAVGVIVVVLVSKLGSSGNNSAIQQRTAIASKGDIGVSVSGSGPIVSSNESKITSAVAGKVTNVLFKEGDSVKVGDLLMEIDDSEAKLNVEKIKNSIAQAQLTANSDSKSLQGLDVKAPFSGRVSNITALKVGDELGKNANILTITDTSRLTANVTFSEAVISDIKVGQKAVVNIQDMMQSVDATVSYVGSSPFASGSGGRVYNVEVTLDNPGSITDGMSVSVEIDTKSGSQMSAGTGMLEYVSTQVVKSVSGGTVRGINVKENQHVESGETLIQIENDDLHVSAQTTSLKMEDLNSQLESAQKQLSEFKIYSPIDGVIVSQTITVGTTVKNADMLCVVSNTQAMEFEIDIDELDIAKIAEGQKANITIDALPQTTSSPISGEVSKISIQGNPSNGVTTYPVTVKISNTDSLKIGMNANAEIIVNEKKDVVMVPIDAVQTVQGKSFVRLKSSGGSRTGSFPARDSEGKRSSEGAVGNASAGRRDSNASAPGPGETAGGNRQQRGQADFSVRQGTEPANSEFVITFVEVGINNDEYIEIISGLQEGDEVIVTSVTASTGQGGANMQFSGGMGGMGGIGGTTRTFQISGNSQRSRP